MAGADEARRRSHERMRVSVCSWRWKELALNSFFDLYCFLINIKTMSSVILVSNPGFHHIALRIFSLLGRIKILRLSQMYIFSILRQWDCIQMQRSVHHLEEFHWRKFAFFKQRIAQNSRQAQRGSQEIRVNKLLSFALLELVAINEWSAYQRIWRRFWSGLGQILAVREHFHHPKRTCEHCNFYLRDKRRGLFRFALQISIWPLTHCLWM